MSLVVFSSNSLLLLSMGTKQAACQLVFDYTAGITTVVWAIPLNNLTPPVDDRQLCRRGG